MKTVLSCGAWLKNRACVLRDQKVTWSALHGDLDDPTNCLALEQSVENLIRDAKGDIQLIAHDLHPDFFSTHLALQIAERIQVEAIAVQHHHAHIGVVMAEHELQEPVIGLALDGVGLGLDGKAWGGELLWVKKGDWRRLGHLSELPLPGGDIAAREPWRMAASALHLLNRSEEIVPRFSNIVGLPAASTVHLMLQRGLNCPLTSSTGRWFDTAAGILGLNVKQTTEAEAAIALENTAMAYLQVNSRPQPLYDFLLSSDGVLDLKPMLGALFKAVDQDNHSIQRAAALFHLSLVAALAEWIDWASKQCGTKLIALAGGCFFNRILRTELEQELIRRGLTVYLPQSAGYGDVGLALGQAWVARYQS